MSHFGDFMDGVPVKISEKYKKPPSIELPYSVAECPLRAQHLVDNIKYCSTFENNVLTKLKELRSAKETKKNERRHRLQLLEEAKQKKLDAVAAAEAEEKLKQLSVSEVSYPSTDELSTLSPDDKVEQNCDITQNLDSSEANDTTNNTNNDEVYSTSSAPEAPPNILQPIQVQTSYNSNSLLDDPDPLQELKMTAKITKIPQYNNIDMLTFKDFENDTSSPFDNVELKTINDMELLAQVLQSQRDSVPNCHQQPCSPENNYITNCASEARVEPQMTYVPNSCDQTGQGASGIYMQQYVAPNGYYLSPDNTCENTLPIDNMNMYIPSYQYYIPNNTYANVEPIYYNNHIPTTSTEANQMSNGTSYIPQPYYFHPPQMSYPTENTNYITHDQTIQNIENQNVLTNSQTTIKSRSRSVPDIVKELNEEIASAKLRANERSYNASPAPKHIPRTSTSSDKEKEKRHKRKAENLPNPMEKLPPSIQNMCKKIHGMGFPIDRVARVSSLLGDNDKKIIEGLLILGELMDLGFTEGRVLGALAKHEFNREKALDELVS